MTVNVYQDVANLKFTTKLHSLVSVCLDLADMVGSVSYVIRTKLSIKKESVVDVVVVLGLDLPLEEDSASVRGSMPLYKEHAGIVVPS